MIVQINPLVHKSAETFSELDPYGFSMAMIAMTVVFCSLILLFVIFKLISKLYTINFKAFFSKNDTLTADPQKKETDGEVIVAIASAIHLFQNQIHDLEDTVLTIKKITKTYTPWSSKIYGLRKTPK